MTLNPNPDGIISFVNVDCGLKLELGEVFQFRNSFGGCVVGLWFSQVKGQVGEIMEPSLKSIGNRSPLLDRNEFESVFQPVGNEWMDLIYRF